MKEQKSNKLNNILLSIIAILAIFFIVWITTYSTTRNQVVQSDSNLIGQVVQVASSSGDELNLAFCKLIIGETTSYKGKTLTTSLVAGESAYYAGHTITVKEITTDVCVVDVDGSSDYITMGQIQRLNAVYVTVKDIVK